MLTKRLLSRIIGWVNMGVTAVVFIALIFMPYGKICELEIDSLFTVLKESEHYMGSTLFFAIVMIIVAVVKIIYASMANGFDLGTEKDTKKLYSFLYVILYVLLSVAGLIIILAINDNYTAYYGIENPTFVNLIIFEFIATLILIAIERVFMFIEFRVAKRSTEDKIVGDFLHGVAKKEGNSKVFSAVGGLVLVSVAISVVTLGWIFPVKMDRSYNYFFNKAEYSNVYDAQFGKNNLPKLNFYNGESITFAKQSGTYILTYYSDNYYFYNDLIKETTDKIGSLMPDGEGEKAFEEYTKKLKQLNDSLNLLREKIYQLNYASMSIKYTLSSTTTQIQNQWGGWETKHSYDIVEIIYDTNVNADYETTKWDVESNKYLFSKKKIELEKYEFSSSTDFTTEKLGVKIFYPDGSMKMYYTTAENAEELNEATGKATFKWSDSWGSYQATVNITE